jgi:hypothetical protein
MSVNNAFCLRGLRDLATLATVLGRADDAAKFSKEADALSSAMTSKMWGGAPGFCDGVCSEVRDVLAWLCCITLLFLCSRMNSTLVLKSQRGNVVLFFDLLACVPHSDSRSWCICSWPIVLLSSISTCCRNYISPCRSCVRASSTRAAVFSNGTLRVRTFCVACRLAITLVKLGSLIVLHA